MENSIDPGRRELRRGDLYEQVWSEAMVRLANRYGISDVALAKICRKMDVPVAPRGYWRRIETGRRPARPPLPKLRPGVRCAVELTVRPDSPDMPTSDPEVEAQEAFERDAENRIRVPRHLADPHPLVSRTAAVLRKATPGLFGTVRAFGEKCLDVRVGPRSIERALRIMDGLVKSLEARGLRVEISEVESRRPTSWSSVNACRLHSRRRSSEPRMPLKRTNRIPHPSGTMSPAAS